MQRDLNHDEHQFLAPGVLLSREGLLPYRDFPLFHMPNLVFAYAALDRLTHSPLAAAKLLSVLASTGVIALLAYWVGRERNLPSIVRVAVCLAGAVLFLFDPLVLFTSGKMWNHEVPTALIVAALVLQAATFSRPSAGVLFCCGLLSALAAGSRLTFGPMLLPLLGAACIAGKTTRDRLRLGLYWSAGAFIGFLPSLWLFLLSPENFVFGNLQFPRLPLSDPTNLRVQKTIRWSAKLRYFFKDVALPKLAVILGVCGGGTTSSLEVASYSVRNSTWRACSRDTSICIARLLRTLALSIPAFLRGRHIAGGRRGGRSPISSSQEKYSRRDMRNRDYGDRNRLIF